MKKLLFLIFFVLFGFLNPVFAYDYTIDSYNVKMVVNEDKTFDITETITAYFYVQKHGIYRDIPLHGTLKRTDGSQNFYRANIENITVSEQFTKSRAGSNLRIKIGNPDVSLTGKKRYEIKYKYFMGNDPIKGKDEFYFNIIGDSWDTQIDNVTFVIKFPKSFDVSEMGFSAGVYGNVGKNKLVYKTKGNIVYGRYYGILRPKEALTIRMELPEGYFKNKFNFNPMDLLFFVPLFFLIISYLIWFLCGRDKKAFEVPDFSPPNNINPIEMAYIYSQNISSRDISTLLIYLASKGYIELIEIEKGDEIFAFSDSKDYLVKKVKPYDGNNTAELRFMRKLFSSGDTIMLSSIYKTAKLYEITGEIKKDVSTSSTVFEKGSLKNQMAVIIFMLLSFISINFAFCNEMGILPAILHITIFPIMGYVLLIYPIIRFLCLGSFSEDVRKFVYWLFWCIIIFAIFASSVVVDNYLLTYYIFGVLCIVLTNVIYFYIPKWTEEGVRLYGRILGFKKYLKKVEVQRLQKLVDEDPQYFYKILPFAFVLGLSRKWIEKFEYITCGPPSYFTGNYDHRNFGRSINRIMDCTTSSCNPPSSSGGGGGFSGGGGGGGGGGSW